MTRVYKVVSRKRNGPPPSARACFAARRSTSATATSICRTPDRSSETVALYFADRDDLVLVALEAEQFGDGLKWEPSRGGALFPHLYATLPLDRVVSAAPFSSRDPERLRALLAPR